MISKSLLPLSIGIALAVLLYFTLNWWGFLIIFPWIGLSISLGVFLRLRLSSRKKLIGRKVSILMVLPCLLFFVPIINNENFQLEGVALIVMAGFFGKGFIHYAIAKIFGPLIWRRGFCGYACWTAAVFDWLPIRRSHRVIPRKWRNLRYIMLFLSLFLPAYLVFALSYDPHTDYISQKEMNWMFAGNALYYLIGVPLAFLLRDHRAFCKYVCPVALVMKPATALGRIQIKPDPTMECNGCNACNRQCPMDIDVKGYMLKNRPVSDTECILCSDCKVVCPVRKIR